MKYCQFFWLMLIPLMGLSQSYEKTLLDGRKWEIYYPMGMGSFIIQEYVLNCDTLLNTTEYAQVKRLDNSRIGYVREDTLARKIYYLAADSTNEELIIDFSLAEGDTFTLNGVDIFVDSVSSVFIFQKTRRVIHFSDFTKFIEGVGSSFYGIIKDSFYKQVWSVEETGLICGNLTGISEPLSTKPILMYPNPAKDMIRLEVEPLRSGFRKGGILLPTGQELAHFTIRDNKNIDLSTYPPGMYLIWVEGYRPAKFVKY
jgi:hypothetical protein